MTSRVLIVGSGILGLRTATSLLRHGHRVTMRSAAAPLASSGPAAPASPGAGGLWMPFHCEDVRVEKWAKHQLEEYLEMINVEPLLSVPHSSPSPYYSQITSLLPSNPPPSSITTKAADTGTYSPTFTPPSWATDPRLNYQTLTMHQLEWQKAVTKIHVPSVLLDSYSTCHTFSAPIVDSPEILNSHLKFFINHKNGGDILTDRFYNSVEEVLEEGGGEFDFIVNCTGGGAKALMSDNELTPGRGCLKYYKRKPGFDTCILLDDPPIGCDERPVYCIPRGDLVAVGGFYLEGDDYPEMRLDEREILEENAEMLLGEFDDEKWEEVGEWVGFRPVRNSGVKLGLNTDVGGRAKWIDCYGHGGSGWTVASGCAEEVAGIIKSST
ncbi:hypothetical protein TrLO_g8658 [Triparma laevis f. longispina]|uniref:FAD dependent oxidoreductase domain-containing protein n=1 Tax=Triparma laevis f. longispina TaxID=1714387 RepID=A0A9W6Z9E6_9STRA|nr:hypothetical protein TrLO_g8658 [Triparma laevis f. longispina]